MDKLSHHPANSAGTAPQRYRPAAIPPDPIWERRNRAQRVALAVDTAFWLIVAGIVAALYWYR